VIGLTPDSVIPLALSGQALGESEDHLETIRYHGGLDLDIELAGTNLGTFLHRCFEMLGSSPDSAEKLPDITGVDSHEANLSKVADCVASFEKWLADRFAIKLVHRELPLLALEDTGSVVSGTADLVLETDEGVWVIVHKSDELGDPEAAFNSYRPQLECYARTLSSMGRKISGLGINWIRRGEVVLARTCAL